MPRPRYLVPVALALAVLVATAGCGGTADGGSPGAGGETTTSAPEPTDDREAADHMTIALWHCGIQEVDHDGRTWEVPDGEEPFDGTNAPRRFVGSGTVERVSVDELRYTDESGITLRLVPDDGVERPCA